MKQKPSASTKETMAILKRPRTQSRLGRRNSCDNVARKNGRRRAAAMTAYDTLIQNISALAGEMQRLQHQAAELYLPIVEDLLRSCSRDVAAIEHTLDGLLDFCGHEPILQLFKKLCRHYWAIDPAATANYIQAYRENWDSDKEIGAPS